jgi:hypothetical protein
MTSERLGEMFKGDSADTSAGKFSLALMGGQVDTSSVRRRGARTPIDVSGNFLNAFFLSYHVFTFGRLLYILASCAGPRQA